MAQMRLTVPQDIGAVVSRLSTAKLPLTVSWIEGEKRTTQMNRLLHRWFGDIARQQGHQSEFDVKADCNLIYGVPIKRRDDPEWASVFGYLFDNLSYAAKVKALRVLDVPVTRNMTVAQLLEYMEQMQRDYLAQGVRLTDPDLRKYGAAE